MAIDLSDPPIEFLTHQPLFDQVKCGFKPFDVRLGNKQVKSGDTIMFVEYDPITGKRGESFIRKVSKVLRTDDLDFWRQEEIDEHGFVVIGLQDDRPVDLANKLYTQWCAGDVKLETVLTLIRVLGGNPDGC